MRSSSSWKHWICRLAVAGVMLAPAGGCNILGAVAYKAFGPSKNPADYTPPKEEPLVVLVENYRNPATLQQPADELATMVSNKLAANKVVTTIIPTEKLVAFRTEKGEAYDHMKIPDIGRALGAKQVVYINMRECSIEGLIGADDVRCNIDVMVKVVDVDSGQTKWPEVGDGKQFQNHTDYNRSEGRKTEEAIRDEVLDDLSDGIAALFYPHQPDSEMPTE